MKKFIDKHKAVVVSYFIAVIGVLIAGSIGSKVVGQEYAPLVFTIGGVFLEKLANVVKKVLGDRV